MVSTREVSPQSPPRQPLSARDPRLAGWRSMLTAHSLLMQRLEEELKAEAGMSLFEYSALLQLAEAPKQRLRMAQIAEGIFVTRSGVSRLVDRLEADGLVERLPCPSDGRGADAVLTDAGMQRLRAASQVHLRGIEAYYFDHVADQDLETVGRVMEDIAGELR
jgi:DNA-binding MarR family transcriptional regulator